MILSKSVFLIENHDAVRFLGNPASFVVVFVGRADPNFPLDEFEEEVINITDLCFVLDT